MKKDKFKKTLLFSVLVSVFSTSYSQKNTYNTKIEKASSVKIYGNGKVDIGTVIVNQGFQNKVYLMSVKESVDSMGIYTIWLGIDNVDRVPITDLKLKVILDKPALNVQFFGTFMGTLSNQTEDKKGYLFEVGQVIKSPVQEFPLLVEITSNTKVHLTIYGLDGNKTSNNK